MRRGLMCLALLPLAGCEPPEAREAPVNPTPGLYVFQLPVFIQTVKGAEDKPVCLEGGYEEALPARLLNLAFETLPDCSTEGPKRKGNYLTIAGACTAPADVAEGRFGIEGLETVSANEVNGSFSLDLSKLKLTTAEGKRWAMLAKVTRFPFKAKRIGEC